MFENKWIYSGEFGYIKESKIRISRSLFEQYGNVHRQLEYGMPVTQQDINEYPNLWLANQLGIPQAQVGQKYRDSYYAQIRMHIMDTKLSGRPIIGELRISGHKVNPYRFGDDNWKVQRVDIDGVPNVFGISIVLPNGEVDAPTKDESSCVAHVFEYVANNGNLVNMKQAVEVKSMLDKIIGDIGRVIKVGVGEDIDPVNGIFHEVTNGYKLFDSYGRRIPMVAQADGPSKVIKPKATRKKFLTQDDIPAENVILVVSPKKVFFMGNRLMGARQQVRANGKVVGSVIRPYINKNGRRALIGLKSGNYLWVDAKTNQMLCAAHYDLTSGEFSPINVKKGIDASEYINSFKAAFPKKSRSATETINNGEAGNVQG